MRKILFKFCVLLRKFELYDRSHKIASGEHYSHHVSPSIAQNYTMLSYKKIPLKYFISHVDSLYHVFYIKIILDVLILCLLTAKYSFVLRVLGTLQILAKFGGNTGNFPFNLTFSCHFLAILLFTF